jgi:hypothetical protein
MWIALVCYSYLAAQGENCPLANSNSWQSWLKTPIQSLITSPIYNCVAYLHGGSEISKIKSKGAIVVIAKWPGDEDDKHRQSLIQEMNKTLRDNENVKIFPQDFSIGTEPERMRESLKQGHALAQKYLQRTGADVLIWVKLATGEKLRAEIHATFNPNRSVSPGTDSNYPNSQGNLSNVTSVKETFDRTDLADVLSDDIKRYFRVITILTRFNGYATNGPYPDIENLKLLNYEISAAIKGTENFYTTNPDLWTAYARILALQTSLFGSSKNSHIDETIEAFEKAQSFERSDQLPELKAYSQIRLATLWFRQRDSSSTQIDQALTIESKLRELVERLNDPTTHRQILIAQGLYGLALIDSSTLSVNPIEASDKQIVGLKALENAIEALTNPDDAHRFMLIIELAKSRIRIASHTGKVGALRKSHDELLTAHGYTDRKKDDFFWSIGLKTLSELDHAIGNVEAKERSTYNAVSAFKSCISRLEELEQHSLSFRSEKHLLSPRLLRCAAPLAEITKDKIHIENLKLIVGKIPRDAREADAPQDIDYLKSVDRLLTALQDPQPKTEVRIRFSLGAVNPEPAVADILRHGISLHSPRK